MANNKENLSPEDIERASDILQQSWEDSFNLIGEEGTLGIAYHLMAHNCLQADQLEEAFDLIVKALNKMKGILPPNHPYLISIVSDVGEICLDSERYQDAQRYFHLALKMIDEGQVPWQEDYLELLINLSECHEILGHPKDAEDTLLSALEMVGEEPDEESEFALTRRYAEFLANQRRPEESLAMFQRALDALDRIQINNDIPNDDPVQVIHRTAVMLEYCNVLMETGKYEDAIKLIEPLFLDFNKVTSLSDPIMIDVLSIKGLCLMRMGKTEEAEKVYQSALKSAEGILEESDPLVLELHLDVADVLMLKKDFDKAEKIVKSVQKKIDEAKSSTDHLPIGYMHKQFGLIYQEKKDYEKAYYHFEEAYSNFSEDPEASHDAIQYCKLAMEELEKLK